MNTPHVYHTRVAWPLLEVYRFTNEEKYKNAAEKQILWALAQSRKNGWFSQMGFIANQSPFTHTIAYTLRGLLESSFYLAEENRQKIFTIVQKASENIMRSYELRKQAPSSMGLPATLDENWQSKDNYSCVTGNAQIAIIWLKLYQLSHDTRFLNSAPKLIDHVKATQCMDCKHLGIRGGIPGSRPSWGKYLPFTYPNWAAKFFVDALLLKEEISHGVD